MQMNNDRLAKGSPGPYLSPLRYPGSKRKLAGYIRDALNLNRLHPSLYVEPFVGGASVALQMLIDEVVERVILIDLDPLIASFWEAVFFDTEWLIEQVLSIEVSIEKWIEYKEKKSITKRDYALACLFKNRTNFSGILREEVGPIGGKYQKSKYKIGCRFPRETLARRIEFLSGYRKRVNAIWACSWKDGISKIREMQSSGKLPVEDVFFYLDPPFYQRGAELYRFYFDDQAHKELRDFLLSLRDDWILSYDDVEQVGALYGAEIQNGTNGAKKHGVELIYSVGIMNGRKPTKELIISNLNQLPTETRFWKTATGIKEK